MAEPKKPLFTGKPISGMEPREVAELYRPPVGSRKFIIFSWAINLGMIIRRPQAITNMKYDLIHYIHQY